MTARLILILALLAAAVYSQSTVSVYFPVKDGFVSPDSCSGSAKFLSVDYQKKSVGWMVFNTLGVDVRNLSSSILVLPVKSVKSGGPCGVHELMIPLAEPENKVTPSALHYDDLPIATISLDSSFSGRMVLLNFTDQVRLRTFKGIVFRSMKNCSVEFNSRENAPSPALLCTYDLQGSQRAKWWSGSGHPDLSVGMQGDLYVEMERGVIFRKSSTAWDSVTTLVPPPPSKSTVEKKPVKPKRAIKKKPAAKPQSSTPVPSKAGASR